MMNAIILAIAALAGVFVGALAEALRSRLAFKREKAWCLFEEQRIRLEQTYEAVAEVGEIYANDYVEAAFALAGSRTTRQSPRRKVPWSRLQMLVHLYSPDLENHLSAVHAVAPDMGTALVVAFSTAAEGGDKRRALHELDRVNDQLMARIKALQSAIVEKAQHLTASATSQVDQKLLDRKR